MARFFVKYKDADGSTKTERMEGGSRSEIISQIRGKGAIPISLEELSSGNKKKKKKKDENKDGGFFQKKVKLDELAVVFRMLSTMLGGGLPIVDSLADVGAQAENPRLKEILSNIAAEIREGASLSESMSKYPKVFSKLIIAMVHAGEESGHMAKILTDLADYLDTQVELRRKIKAGTSYPLFILGFFILAVGGLFIFILPRFETIFADLDADMPVITELVMGFSRALGGNIHFILVGVIALTIGIISFKRTERGRQFFDTLILKVPVVGPMAQKIVVARLSRSLGLLIDSGIPVVESLNLTGEISGNWVFQHNIEDIRDNIVRGATLSDEMKGRPFFPQMLIRMTAAGESTGSLSEMLERVSQHFTREASTSIDSVLSLLEPLLLGLLGGVVAVVILAVYLPIFQLATAM